MSKSNAPILVVDDDPHILSFLSIYIEGAGYTPIQAKNGKEGFNSLLARDGKVAAIISDVDMPEMNGYALCKAVRSDENLREIPFVFVSALISLEERLKGYETGGDDYITKPLQGEEVVAKINHIIEKKIRHETLAGDLQASRNAALQAMSYTSNLGQILQFMKDAMQVFEFKSLAALFLGVTESMGLAVVVQFLAPEGALNYKKEGEVTPLEANVLELARDKSRIFDFGARTIFNYEDFSVLIKNMPLENKEKYGLLKDVLGNLCDALEVRVKGLLTHARVQAKEDVIKTVTEALQRIDQSYRDIQKLNMAALDETIRKMEDAMMGFGLTEQQEDTVRGIITYAKRRTTEAFEDGNSLYDEFDKIKTTLQGGLD
ncbi:MAG: response regulator [Gammaproteobacteria bacterium]|nr:response regulator [Gammaproteobacteria bacterium]MDH5653549.1 response regulator [Gammaproteobacteria bacterium]